MTCGKSQGLAPSTSASAPKIPGVDPSAPSTHHPSFCVSQVPQGSLQEKCFSWPKVLVRILAENLGCRKSPHCGKGSQFVLASFGAFCDIRRCFKLCVRLRLTHRARAGLTNEDFHNLIGIVEVDEVIARVIENRPKPTLIPVHHSQERQSRAWVTVELSIVRVATRQIRSATITRASWSQRVGVMVP